MVHTVCNYSWSYITHYMYKYNVFLYACKHIHVWHIHSTQTLYNAMYNYYRPTQTWAGQRRVVLTTIDKDNDCCYSSCLTTQIMNVCWIRAHSSRAYIPNYVTYMLLKSRECTWSNQSCNAKARDPILSWNRSYPVTVMDSHECMY